MSLCSALLLMLMLMLVFYHVSMSIFLSMLLFSLLSFVLLRLWNARMNDVIFLVAFYLFLRKVVVMTADCRLPDDDVMNAFHCSNQSLNHHPLCGTHKCLFSRNSIIGGHVRMQRVQSVVSILVMLLNKSITVSLHDNCYIYISCALL